MTNFFLSEMYRMRKHLVIQTAGVWLWSTSERQTLRYRASLSHATLDPSQRRRVKQNPTPRAAQWEPVVPVFTPNAQAKIKTKTKFRERTQILSGKQRRKIPSPSFWFSTSDLELLRSARAPLPGGRASGGKTTVNCRHFHRSVNKRDALNSWISSSRQWRSSWQNMNMFESVQLWTFRCYLEASLARVDAGFFFSMCVCECVVQVFTCIHKLPTRPPTPHHGESTSVLQLFLDKISQQTAWPNRWTTASAFQRRLSGDIVHNTVNNSRKSISHNPAESVYQKKKKRKERS